MKISAIMMVKNESTMIDDCLKSLVGLIDELAIIDTGSQDNTIEKIHYFINKYPEIELRLVEVPWNNHFGDMRNKTVELATGDILLQIDADERISYASNINAESFKKILTISFQNPKFDAASVILQDWQNGIKVMSCSTCRFFKKGRVLYEGRIHNVAKFELENVAFGNVYLNHYGYNLDTKTMNRKLKRTYSGLMKDYEESKRMHVEFFLAQIFGTRNALNQAIYWGEKYLETEKENPSRYEVLNPAIYYSLACLYQHIGRIDDGIKLITKAISLYPNDPDYYYCASDLYGYGKQDYWTMAYYARKYLEARELLRIQPIHTGKFYFTLNEEIRRNCIYRVAIITIKEFYKAFNILKKAKKGNQDNKEWNHLLKTMQKIGLKKWLKQNV